VHRLREKDRRDQPDQSHLDGTQSTHRTDPQPQAHNRPKYGRRSTCHDR
jgi:hypothetical protein